MPGPIARTTVARIGAPSKFAGFQLRNFQLHLDQMEELELDAEEFASYIAEALTLVHWACHVDANDVEFVLGSAPDYIAEPHLVQPHGLTASQVAKTEPNSSTWDTSLKKFHRRTTHIWMLDFNRCALFKPDRDGMKQLVHSFFRNDPYFPRSHAELERDQELWQTFRKVYLATSQICVNRGKLPEAFSGHLTLFLDMVDTKQKARLNLRKAQSEARNESKS